MTPLSQEARQDLASLTAVLDLLHCGVAVLDRAGVFHYVNERVAKMAGRPAGALVGQNVRSLYPSDDAAIAFLKSALKHADESRDDEFYLPAADGTRIHIACASSPLRGTLADLHVVTMQDISAQKSAEEGLREQFKYITQLSDTAFEQAISLKHHSEILESKVRERTAALRNANLDAIYMLAEASEAKDHDTGMHVRRIQNISQAIALKLGLSAAAAEEIAYSAVLHDVGKMHIPDQILSKPGPLTPAEMSEMRRHTVYGESIIIGGPFFDMSRRIARSHHEDYAGTGYPDGLAGEAIPLEARIVRAADVFDALGAKRPYKQPWPLEKIRAEFVAQTGKAFDPAVAACVLEMIDGGQLVLPA